LCPRVERARLRPDDAAEHTPSGSGDVVPIASSTKCRWGSRKALPRLARESPARRYEAVSKPVGGVTHDGGQCTEDLEGAAILFATHHSWTTRRSASSAAAGSDAKPAHGRSKTQTLSWSRPRPRSCSDARTRRPPSCSS